MCAVIMKYCFFVGPDLPLPMQDHCVARIDANRFIFAGGMDTNFDLLATTFIYDWNINTWSIGPDLPEGRKQGACGVVNSTERGLEFVYTGNLLRPMFGSLSLIF